MTPAIVRRRPYRGAPRDPQDVDRAFRAPRGDPKRPRDLVAKPRRGARGTREHARFGSTFPQKHATPDRCRWCGGHRLRRGFGLRKAQGHGRAYGSSQAAPVARAVPGGRAATAHGAPRGVVRPPNSARRDSRRDASVPVDERARRTSAVTAATARRRPMPVTRERRSRPRMPRAPCEGTVSTRRSPPSPPLCFPAPHGRFSSPRRTDPQRRTHPQASMAAGATLRSCGHGTDPRARPASEPTPSVCTWRRVAEPRRRAAPPAAHLRRTPSLSAPRQAATDPLLAQRTAD